jgi:glycosyltransferase involved in cell wall biosynthesis
VRICLSCVEIFAFGKHGGFGKIARALGAGLASRGHELFAVVPRRAGQGAVERLDGITVYGYRPARPWEAWRFFRECRADLYHSVEPSVATAIARAAAPAARHSVMLVDPRDPGDWRIEMALPSASRVQVLANRLFEDGPVVRAAVRQVDAVFASAHFQCDKAMPLYRLPRRPRFLPMPVDVPEACPSKAPVPTVCYLARLDRRKRPERYFELAGRFPGVRFIVMGKGRDAAYEAGLRERFGALPNLEWVGFVDPYRTDALSALLGRSWILANTAAREGLPVSFIEAAAHGCAILSQVDPDGFASRFGHHAADGDFEAGLARLLEGGRWRRLGSAGREHVRAVFETGAAVDAHEAAFRELVTG